MLFAEKPARNNSGISAAEQPDNSALRPPRPADRPRCWMAKRSIVLLLRQLKDRSNHPLDIRKSSHTQRLAAISMFSICTQIGTRLTTVKEPSEIFR
jgi:hypothetical protein